MMLMFNRMWKHLRALPVAVAGLLLATATLFGQSAPPTMPDKTVYGRLGTGTGSGPAQAIPFATLLAQLSSAGGTTVGFITVPGVGLIPVAPIGGMTLYASPSGTGNCYSSGAGSCTLPTACLLVKQIATFLGAPSIQLADGTYTAADTSNFQCHVAGNGGGSSNLLVNINGDSITPTNVIIAIQSGQSGFYAEDGAEISVGNLEITDVNGGGTGLTARQNVVFDYKNIYWGTWGNSGSHVSAFGNAVIVNPGSETLLANTTFNIHWNLAQGAYLVAGGTTTIQSNVTWSQFVAATNSNVDTINWTLSGTGTGQQFTGLGIGYLNANGSCASTFPGTGGCNLTLGFMTSNGDLQTAAFPLEAASVANAKLVNPATTVNGQTCTLGSTCTITTGSGASIYLCTITASNSAVMSYASASAGTCTINGTYTSYTLILQNIIPATNEKILELEIHISGSGFKTSGYITSQNFCANSTCAGGNPTTYIPLSYPSDANAASLANTAPGFSGTVSIITPSVSGLISVISYGGYLDGGGLAGSSNGFGYWNTAGVVDGFELLMDSGNITSGAIQVYGNQ
jgi:hypothetical protein